MDKIDIKLLSLNELKLYFTTLNEKSFRAEQVYEWLHKKLAVSFDDMTNLSKPLRSTLADKCYITNFSIVDIKESADGTCKYLFELMDKNLVECVLMRYHHGISVCISTQVGCRMGCKFCASAIGGLIRSLSVSELLESVYMLNRIAGERISNIVLMGTGEPMDNYDNVVNFIKMISDKNGLNISQRSITVSTCGIPHKIRDFADEGLNVTLALSLHAPNDDIRRELMPSAKSFKLSDIIAAFDYYYNQTGRRLTFEYSLIEGVNDRKNDAYALSRMLFGKNAHVNLIPINPINEQSFKRTNKENILFFKNILEKNRINVTIRREMGMDIDAACGQLRLRSKNLNKS